MLKVTSRSQFHPKPELTDANRDTVRHQSNLPSNRADSDENLSQYTVEDDYGNVDILKEKMAEMRMKKRNQLKEGVLNFMKSKGIVNEEDKRDHTIFANLSEGVEDIMTLTDNRGQLLYRRGSFKRLLKNDSLKYFDNGMQEVFDEFQKYSIKS